MRHALEITQLLLENPDSFLVERRFKDPRGRDAALRWIFASKQQQTNQICRPAREMAAKAERLTPAAAMDNLLLDDAEELLGQGTALPIHLRRILQPPPGFDRLTRHEHGCDEFRRAMARTNAFHKGNAMYFTALA